MLKHPLTVSGRDARRLYISVSLSASSTLRGLGQTQRDGALAIQAHSRSGCLQEADHTPHTCCVQSLLELVCVKLYTPSTPQVMAWDQLFHNHIMKTKCVSQKSLCRQTTLRSNSTSDCWIIEHTSPRVFLQSDWVLRIKIDIDAPRCTKQTLENHPVGRHLCFGFCFNIHVPKIH